MRARRRWLFPFGLVILGVLVFTAWASWRAWQVNENLTAAVDDAQQLRAAVLAEDSEAQQQALTALQDHSQRAADVADGPTWSILTKLPAVGDDAQGVRTASAVVADLATRGVEPLLRTTGQMDALLPRNGRVSIDALVDLQDPVAEGAQAFADAERRLATEDPSSYVARLRDKYRELTAEVADASRVLRAANTALTVMPGMLGGEGPRHYLLVFQNNAEIRSTGGLPGAVSLVTATDGKVEMTRQVAAGSFGERSTPVLPLTSAERRIYGKQLGTYFLDANFTPDFPRTADLMRARWEEFYEDIDGVVSIDPVALSYILRVAGPVSTDEVTLTSDDAVDQLLHQVYLDHESPAAQDAFFRVVARAVFDRVSSGVGPSVDLAQALGQAVHEGRIYVHSFSPSEQETLDASTVAGRLTSGDASSPQVGLFLNDATGSKMSYYLRYRARVDSTYCADGAQGIAGSAHLSSVAPDDAAALPPYITGGGAFGTDPGSQLVLVRLYAPVGGSISDVELNSRLVRDLQVVTQDDRPVGTVVVELGPGENADLSWRMKTGPDQEGPVRLSVTPSIEAGDASSTAVSSCA